MFYISVTDEQTDNNMSEANSLELPDVHKANIKNQRNVVASNDA